MGDQPTGHHLGERLFIPGNTWIHRLPAQTKIASLLVTMLVVVATPGDKYWAFIGYALLMAAVVKIARIPLRTLLTRMTVEIPFVVFALLMPFIGAGPQVQFGPLSLSEPGLLAAWTLMAKATLGVVGSIVLAATTTSTEMIAGLRKLRLPDLLVQIFASMIRYVHVVFNEAARMSRARKARGFTAKGPAAWTTLGKTLGTLFIRSYERGERVHLAMSARGYSGQMPELHPLPAATAQQLISAAVLPAAAAIVLLCAWLWGTTV